MSSPWWLPAQTPGTQPRFSEPVPPDPESPAWFHSPCFIFWYKVLRGDQTECLRKFQVCLYPKNKIILKQLYLRVGLVGSSLPLPLGLCPTHHFLEDGSIMVMSLCPQKVSAWPIRASHITSCPPRARISWGPCRLWQYLHISPQLQSQGPDLIGWPWWWVLLLTGSHSPVLGCLDLIRIKPYPDLCGFTWPSLSYPFLGFPAFLRTFSGFHTMNFTDSRYEMLLSR